MVQIMLRDEFRQFQDDWLVFVIREPDVEKLVDRMLLQTGLLIYDEEITEIVYQ